MDEKPTKPKRYEYPFNTWRLQNQNLRGSDVWQKVSILSAVAGHTTISSTEGFTWEAYIANRQSPSPDVVKLVAEYGYARMLVRGWTELPLTIPSKDMDAWIEWGFGPTYRDFHRSTIANAAGGFIEGVVNDSSAVTLIRTQLNTVYRQLDEFTAKPIEWFDPAEFTESELDDRYDEDDFDRIFEPFKLYEQLVCFQYAFPKLRDFTITNTSEEFGLPNRALYEALLEVDLNRLFGKIETYDKALKVIARRVGSRVPRFHAGLAPEEFWWRHWNSQGKRGARSRGRK